MIGAIAITYNASNSSTNYNSGISNASVWYAILIPVIIAYGVCYALHLLPLYFLYPDIEKPQMRNEVPQFQVVEGNKYPAVQVPVTKSERDYTSPEKMN